MLYKIDNNTDATTTLWTYFTHTYGKHVGTLTCVIFVSTTATDYYRQAFFQRTAKEWNKLPQWVVQVSTLDAFPACRNPCQFEKRYSRCPPVRDGTCMGIEYIAPCLEYNRSYETCFQNHHYHTFFTLSYSDRTIIITHRSFRSTCLNSRSFWNHAASHHSEFLEPPLMQRPLFEQAGFICYTYTAITFDHLFTISLWAQNLPFWKLSTLVYVPVCRTDLVAIDMDLFAYRFYVSFILFCFSYSYVRAAD